MMKRLLQLVAVIAVGVGMIIAMSGAAMAEQEGDFTYTVTDGKATITGYTGPGGDVVIPNLDGEDADLCAIHISDGALSPAFDKDILSYYLILDGNIGSVDIEPELSTGTATMEIDGVAAQSKTISIANGTSKTVTIVVTASGGQLQKVYKLTVYRQRLDRFFSTGALIMPYDRAMVADGSIFLTGKDKAFVYKLDSITGAVSVLPVPGIAEHLSYTGDVLLVTLENPALSKHSIGIIDLDTFSLVDSFDVETKLNGVRGDANYIYAYNSSTLFVYSRTGYQKISSLGIDVYEMQINPVNGLLYIGEYYDIHSYRVIDGQLHHVKASGDYRNGSFTILPDGQHLVQDNGTILSCSDNASNDLVFKSRLKNVTSVVADDVTNEMYILDDRTITVYDATSFAFIRIMPENTTVKYIMCAGGNLVVAQGNNPDYPDLHWGFTDTVLKSLKIDGDAFSEFYPLHFNVNPGEIPYSVSSVEITTETAQLNAEVTGDTGLQPLSIGENSFTVTVTDPSTGTSNSYTIKLTRRASDPTVGNAFTGLRFYPIDFEIDLDQNVEYIIPYERNSVYRIDLETGAITSKQFDLAIRSMAVKNGKLYLALARGPKDNNREGYGAVAVINTATFKTEHIFNTDVHPYDLVVDESGIVYISPGENTGSLLFSYDSKTGQYISSAFDVIQWSLLHQNPLTGKLYTINTYGSPTVLNAFETSNGNFTGHYSSPYRGEYPMTFVLRISPDGNFIFNGSGNIFRSAPTQMDDMVYLGSLHEPYTSICFDLSHDRFYTSKGNTLTAYSYHDRAELISVTSKGIFADLQMNSGKIVAVIKESATSGSYYIKEFAPDTLLSDLAIDGTPVPSFDPLKYEYCIEVPTNTSSINISATLFDANGAISGDIGNQTVNYGQNTFIISVRGADGEQPNTYMLNVIRKMIPVTGVSLDKEAISLLVNQSNLLTAIVYPSNSTNQGIIWSSNDDSIATVANGQVLGVAPGNTVIYVTTVDGEKVDSCEITVKWATVSFDSQGGTPIPNQAVNFDSVVNQPNNPIRTGYTFCGWYRESICNSAWDFEKDKVISDITLYAKWTINTHTVTFNPQGGTAVSPKTAQYGTTITAPTPPTRAGYFFQGWYKETACTNAWNFANDKVTSNITLYAKWASTTPAAVKAASASYTSVKVTWSAVPGAAGYQVYSATSSAGPWTLKGTVTTPSFTNTGLVTGKSYYYKVRSYNAAKVYSAYSAVVSARPIPPSPSSVKAVAASYSSVKVSWGAVSGATRFEVYRATSSSGSYTLVGTTTATSFTNTGLRTGSPYYYKVRCYHLEGSVKVYSAFSAVVSAKTAIGTPGSVRAARASSTSIRVTWGKVSGATKYELWRSTSSGGTYALVATTSSLYYTNSRLTTARTYYYKVRAYRLVGSTKVYGPWSATVSARP